MNKAPRRQKGFTLIELMVVVMILAVLTGIVAGGVFGGKSAGEDAQAKSDAATTEQAVKRFQNESLSQEYPETTVTQATVQSTSTTSYTAYKVNGKYLKSDLLTDLGLQVSSGNVTNYKELKWSATALVRKPDGTSMSVTFVPVFVPRKSEAAEATRKDVAGVTSNTGSASSPATATAADEYLWLLLAGTTYDPSWNEVTLRQLQIWKLNDLGTKYTLLHPEATPTPAP